MGDASHSPAFEAAADRVLQRVMLRRWVILLAATLRSAAGVLVVAMVLQWAGWIGGWVAFLLLALWLAGAAVWTWRHRPGPYEALALWDHVRKQSEAFAAAWWFEKQPAPTIMQKRHVEAQTGVLNEALPRLAQDLPLALNHWLWAAPAIACLGLLGGAFHHGGVRDEPLSEAMKQTVVKEAKDIARTDWQKKKLQGLTEQEKKDIDKLKQDIKTTAESLEASSSKSAREVLNDLEKRAHEAEKLAQKLSSNADAWASEKLVAALRKHADTSDLGDAVANKNAAQSAKASGDLASQLKAPNLSEEVRNRLAASLKEVRKDAEVEDRKRIVGGHVMAAGDEMELGKVPEAAGEFEKLASEMQDLARREQSRKELEKLAQQLRDAGSRIAGNQGGGMQQMAAAGQQAGQQQGQSGQAGQQATGQQPQQMAQQPLQPPGLMQQGQAQMMQEAPQGAMGQPQQMAAAQAQPGKPMSGQGRPMLMAPDPRASPDQQPSALIAGKEPAKDPNGPSIAVSGPGGIQAGSGTAKLEAGKTAQQKAGHDIQVGAAQGNEGQSSRRSVEGGIRKEDAARGSPQQEAIQFIQQQEEALDDAALPAARREQVRRYFTELRKRFEAAEK